MMHVLVRRDVAALASYDALDCACCCCFTPLHVFDVPEYAYTSTALDTVASRVAL